MKSKYIENREMELLVSFMSSEDFFPLAVSLETGLRIGDVLSLTHADIRGNCIHYVAQKTKKAGIAKISPYTAKRLKQPNGSEWCFPGRKAGTHLTRQAVWKRIKRACLELGLCSDGVSPHSMRKNFAVDLKRACGVEAVKTALQHGDLHTTEIYALADWTTGENAELPILRKDLKLVVDEIMSFLKVFLDKSN